MNRTNEFHCKRSTQSKYYYPSDNFERLKLNFKNQYISQRYSNDSGHPLEISLNRIESDM